MFLLLVVRGDVTRGVLQADGELVVVRHALARRLAVLVETHFFVVDDAVHVVPRPANHTAVGSGDGSGDVVACEALPVGRGAHLLEAFLLWPSHSCLRCSSPSWGELESRFLVGSVVD